MKIAFLKYLMLFILVVIIALFVITKLYMNERSKNQRLSDNLIHLNKDIEYYKTENGKVAARNHVLQLRKNELEKIFPELNAQINNLKVKLSRTKSLSQNAIQSRLNLAIPLKDSIVDDTVNTKMFRYEDQFHKLVGIAKADTQYISIQSIDTLTQLVFRGKRRKPYLWIFSKRQLEQVISSSNPNSKIIYSKHIQITKR